MHAKERFSRFFKRWFERQNPFTRGDIKKRDGLLRTFSLWAYRRNVTANKTTGIGTILTILWIVVYELAKFKSPLFHLAFIIPIGVTDFLDGSLARNNDDVTPLGTLSDYFRDLIFGLYLGRVSLDYGLDWRFFTGIAVIEFVALILKSIAFIWYGGGHYTYDKLLEFALDSFQGEIYDRVHFNFVCFGLSAFMVGAYYQISFFNNAGLILIWISLGLGIAIILKELTWTPTPVEKSESQKN